jgi:hypothetical protein
MIVLQPEPGPVNHTNLVDAITGTSPGRAVSNANHRFEGTGIEVDRTAKVIPGEIPYSLPLGLVAI